jgi:hypothetical protein
MTYATKPILPEDKELMDWTGIHKSACQHARDAYTKEYGVDYHDDPEYKTGNDRHAVWLKAYDDRFSTLILNPHQD